MIVVRLLLPALLGCLAASAADRELTGSVVDANTGQAIAHAHLTVRFLAAGQPAPEVTILSDADGTFQITNMPDGPIQVSCEKTGYLPANQMMAAMPPPLQSDGKHSATMVLKLVAQAVLEGTVVDDRDIPAQGAFIQLIRQQVLNGRRELQSGGIASTDEVGHFRVFGLVAGRYYVSIMPQIRGSKAWEHLAYPRLYYPAAPDVATAQAIDLKAGDDAEIKVRLPAPAPAFEVRGVVATNAQYVMPTLLRQPLDDQQPVGNSSWDPDKKSFKISHVPAGIYQLIVAVNPDGKSSSLASTIVSVENADVTGLRLEPADSTIDGAVRFEGDGAPPKIGGFVTAQSESQVNGGQVNADGIFHIPIFQPGTYRIMPQINGTPACVRSVQSGGRDLRDGVAVGSGAKPDLIEVVMTTHCGSVDVTLASSDSPAPPNLTVYLLRKFGSQLLLEKQGFRAPQTSDGATHFTIPGVSPGDYMVYVWQQDLPIEYTNAEYMKPFETYGQAVSVTVDSKATVTIDKVLTLPAKN